MLAGLACYALLIEFHVAAVVSVVAGFLFAFLVRIAANSLLRDARIHGRERTQR